MPTDLRDNIVKAFELPTVLGMWPLIRKSYELLGFHDELSDEKMISEYKYIAEQYRKYVASHEKQIMKCKDFEEMAAVVEKMISSAPEIDSERKTIVYYYLRDNWLSALYNSIRVCGYFETATPSYLTRDEEM